MTSVDRLYEESRAMISAMPEHEISLRNAAADLARKALLLGAASYFEHRITNGVLDFVRHQVSEPSRVYSLVKNKAVNRSYHTWFKWELSNANAFFSMFGQEFKEIMDKKIKGSDELRDAVRAFLELGNGRNKLVHGDFASFTLEKTMEEIYSTYKQGLIFVEEVTTSLKE